MTDRAALLAWLLELILRATGGPGVGVVLTEPGAPRTGAEAIEVRFRGKRYLIRVDEAEA